MDNSTINISEVARILNTTPLNILMHVKRGLLVGHEDEEGWKIEGQSLSAFLENHGGSKSVDVCASGCAKKHACGGGCG